MNIILNILEVDARWIFDQLIDMPFQDALLENMKTHYTRYWQNDINHMDSDDIIGRINHMQRCLDEADETKEEIKEDILRFKDDYEKDRNK